MPLVELILLIATILVGAVTVALALNSQKYAISVNRKAIKTRSTSLAFIVFGFIVHTFGDYLEVPYGEEIELAVESLAHVILLVGFIILCFAAKSILKETQKYWFKSK